MADFAIAIEKTLAKEGGGKLTNAIGDRGGVTKYGISQSSYPNINIQDLTESQAKEIYKRDYWDKVSGDQLTDQFIAESIFDFAVNAGVRTASKLAQLAIDVSADGFIGVDSVAALNAAPRDHFMASYFIAKTARYAHICNEDPSQVKFLLGWINRALGSAS